MDRNLSKEKAGLRLRAYDARNRQEGKDTLSQVICDRFIALPDYERAETVMWYLHCRSEVRTRGAVAAALESGKRVVIPYCTKDAAGRNKLGLWLLESLEELVPGTWNIAEPPRERWGEAGREISPEALDIIMVPGVAFDRRCGRLGNGAGYYDRLLKQVRPETMLVGVCFQCQLFDRVPMAEDDVFMDRVITEAGECRCGK